MVVVFMACYKGLELSHVYIEGARPEDPTEFKLIRNHTLLFLSLEFLNLFGWDRKTFDEVQSELNNEKKMK